MKVMKVMKVKTLHKILGKLIKDGNGHNPICVNKDTFVHNLENDGCVIIPVCTASVEQVLQMDGDGYILENKNGTERYKATIVIKGNSEST